MKSISNAAHEPLDTPSAAQRLGVSPYTLVKWRFLAKGPVYSRRGRKIVYAAADLDAYERATRQIAGAVPAVEHAA